MPLIVDTEPVLFAVAVMPPVKVSTPPAATRGSAPVMPAVLFSVRPASEFAPTSVSVELPLSTGALAAAICPLFVTIVTVPPLIVRPPAGTTNVATAPFSESTPPFTTVPPE